MKEKFHALLNSLPSILIIVPLIIVTIAVFVKKDEKVTSQSYSPPPTVVIVPTRSMQERFNNAVDSIIENYSTDSAYLTPIATGSAR